MQCKIREQLNIQETKQNLVVFTKKSQLNLGRGPQSSLPTDSWTRPSVPHCLERNKALWASFTHRKICKKETVCSYCNKSEHKMVQCQKKIRNAKQSKETEPNANREEIVSVKKSSTSQCQAKDKRSACQQWLMMAPTDQKIPALVDATSNLNFIWKIIIVHLRLRPFFPTRTTIQAGGKLLKTYWGSLKSIEITDSFGAQLKARVILISAGRMSLILRLSWL